MKFRPLEKDDHSLLPKFLYQAIFVPPGDQKPSTAIINEPEILRYIINWGVMNGDKAIVAEANTKIIGMAWGRIFKFPGTGYGYINDDTPEISISILPEYRNQGVRTKLLKKLFRAYKKDKTSQLSLSVDKRNPALELYKKIGFREFGDKGQAITMIKHL